MSKSIGILIPTYKRWDPLTKVVSDIFVNLNSWLTSHRQELSLGKVLLTIVLVNDGGLDPNEDTINKLTKNLETYRSSTNLSASIEILTIPKNQGQRLSTLTGLMYLLELETIPEWIVTLDDDGGHPPKHLPGMLKALGELGPLGLVYGFPMKTPTPKIAVRKLGTAMNTWLFQKYLGLPKGIQVGSFRAFTYQLAQRAIDIPVTFPYLSAMLLTAGAQVGVYQWNEQETLQQDHYHQQSPTSYTLLSLAKTFGTLLIHWGPMRKLMKIKKGRTITTFLESPSTLRIHRL